MYLFLERELPLQRGLAHPGRGRGALVVPLLSTTSSNRCAGLVVWLVGRRYEKTSQLLLRT